MAKAKSSKPSDQSEAETAKPEDVVDAVTEEVTEDQDSVEASTEIDTSDEPETPKDEALTEDAPKDDAQPEDPALDDTLAEDVFNSSGPAEVLDDDIRDDLASSETETPAPQPTVVQEKVIERKGGFVPMALGGIVAAALGFGAAQFTDMNLFGAPEPNPFEQEAKASIDAQSQQIANLEAGLGEAQKAIGIIDLNPIMSSVAGVEDTLSGLTDNVTALDASIAGLDSRITAIEKAPVAEAVGPEAIAAYERELEELRLAITAQKQAVEEQKAEIQAMAEKALAANANAEEQATIASSRNALAELIALAQAGKPYGEPLLLLTANGVEVPTALSAAAADGVPTITALASEFPDLARDALSVARRAAPAEEGGGGLATFLSNQLGARSVTPREGNDPDAVLSRAEAAVKAGDLDTALSELQALPAEAQAVLADWVSRANSRKDALAAAQSLAQDLNKE